MLWTSVARRSCALDSVNCGRFFFRWQSVRFHQRVCCQSLVCFESPQSQRDGSSEDQCRRVNGSWWMDRKEIIFLGIAAYVCQICHSTTDLVSATPPSGAIAWRLCILASTFGACRAVSCRVCNNVKGTASPPVHLSHTSSTIVNCKTGHTKARSRCSDGNLSYTTVSCAQKSSQLRHCFAVTCDAEGFLVVDSTLRRD